MQGGFFIFFLYSIFSSVFVVGVSSSAACFAVLQVFAEEQPLQPLQPHPQPFVFPFLFCQTEKAIMPTTAIPKRTSIIISIGFIFPFLLSRTYPVVFYFSSGQVRGNFFICFSRLLFLFCSFFYCTAGYRRQLLPPPPPKGIPSTKTYLSYIPYRIRDRR